MKMERFNFDANDATDAIHYLTNRAVQMLKFDVRFIGVDVYDEGVVGTFEHEQKKYQSIYIFSQQRGKGSYAKLFEKLSLPVITSHECNLEEFLRSKQYHYICFLIEEFPEYKLIQQHYGNAQAKRSGLFYMNHIDEGLAILRWRGASDDAQRAFCLHPIFQADADLLKSVEIDFSGVSNRALINAVEYRSVANDYLSTRVIHSVDEIRLSLLEDVQAMLVADKIQNRKDFEQFHQNHPRYGALDAYFQHWMQRLGICEQEYQETVLRLSLPNHFVK